jgi:ribosomal-protein-alanine N-acetyltransferase
MTKKQPLNNIQVKQITSANETKKTASELFEVANSGVAEGSPWTEQQFLETLDSALSIIIGAYLGEELLGFLVGSQTKFEAEIYFIVVREDYKNQAIGERLLDFLVQLSKEANLEAILLEVRTSNKPARRLYEKRAFKEVGVRKAYYSSPIEDAILMKLDL